MHSKIFKATPQEQLKEIKRGVVEILPESDLLNKLENSYNSDKPLIIKFGADPSRPDIHLGHTVTIQKLKVFQDLGHEVHFLIGDFTAQIGDPTGRSKTRVQLSPEEVTENAKTYQEQIFKILDPKKTKIRFNSHWLNQINLREFLQILMTTTVSQLITREDFAARFSAEQPIYLHEFMYPILQGYDSVAMKADVEFGGTDQKFNLLMGRHLQKCFQQPEQVLIIMPILEGLDGVQKMSKSYDNYIALTDSPKDMFGKLMSISDDLMWRYYDLLSALSTDEIKELLGKVQQNVVHPFAAKKQLAVEIVDRYHGSGAGAREHQQFDELFSKRVVDTAKIPVTDVSVDPSGQINLVTLLVEKGFAKSRTNARSLIQQKAIKIDGVVVSQETFHPEIGKEYLLRAGKLHFLKFKV